MSQRSQLISKPNHRLILRHPVPTKRGASRSSRTLVRDAVDADALVTNSVEADGQVVWFRRPGAGVKFLGSKLLRGDGDNKPVTEEITKQP